MKNGYFCLSFCSREFHVYSKCRTCLSTAVHYCRSEMCDWFYLLTSTCNRFSQFHKITLCIGYNSQASQICGSVPYFNIMLIINFSCYCATATVNITAVLLDYFGGERIAYRISVWQHLLGRSRMWCEDGIKPNHKETVYEGVNLHWCGMWLVHLFNGLWSCCGLTPREFISLWALSVEDWESWREF